MSTRKINQINESAIKFRPNFEISEFSTSTLVISHSSTGEIRTINRTKMRNYFLLLVFSLFPAFLNARDGKFAPNPEKRHIIQETRFGILTGALEKTEHKGTPYIAWTAVPYADPPVRGKRFKPPEPVPGWGRPGLHVVDATHPPPVCPQWTIDAERGVQTKPMIGKEDCLYVNIYNARESQVQPLDPLKPVLVWFHGGDFISGSGSPDFYGPDYFMDEESMVLVTVNYRLGALGFLSLENEAMPGNLGLRDQTRALTWIQENIDIFGGDKRRVTIAGHGAGAVSVMYHLLSEASAGLFHGAIMQSGPAIRNAKLAFIDKTPKGYGTKFVHALQCNAGADEGRLMACLQKLPVETLMTKQTMFEEMFSMPNVWKPVVDSFAEEPFLRDDPEKLMKEGLFSADVPVILGGVSDEACMITARAFKNQTLAGEIKKDVFKYGPFLLFGGMNGTKSTAADKSVVLKMLNRYVRMGKITPKNWMDLQDLLTNWGYLAPIDATAKLMQDNYEGNVYYYNYRYGSDYSVSDELDLQRSFGICHGDDLNVLFNTPKSNPESDTVMIDKMIGIWTKFVNGEDLRLVGWMPLKKGMADPKVRMVLLDEHMLGMRVEGSEPEEVGLRFQFTVETMDQWLESRGGLWKNKREKKQKKKEDEEKRILNKILDEL